jgi:hypothetical protein
MENIPTRFRGTCEFCGKAINTSESGVHQFVRGWVMNRMGGGGHGVSLPEREPRFACGYCIKLRTEGSFGQTSMFEATAPSGTVDPEPGPTNAGYDGHLLVHVCNVCGGPACFGIGVAVKEGDLGLWYCSVHQPVEKVR